MDSVKQDVFIFANPIAGRGRGKQIAVRIAQQLKHEKFNVHRFEKPAAATSDAELASAAGAYAAITIGGDGTLRAAVERLIAFSSGDLKRIPPVLVVPLGTANLMSRHLGIAWDDETIATQVAIALLNGKTQYLDAARANGRLFLLMAGVGIDAMVVHELDRLRSGPIDLTSYALPALLAIHRYDYPPLHVEIDGEVVCHNTPAMAFVGNTPEYGTGFPILTQARSDDGLLDVCVLPCRTRLQVIRLLMHAATGDHVREEGVIYRKAKKVKIASPQEVPVQIDGDAAGHTPLEIELLPFKLPFIVPGG
jgi:YegS/Rv2252/BmrU family lipid kinase